jgi:hypothetical protein
MPSSIRVTFALRVPSTPRIEMLGKLPKPSSSRTKTPGVLAAICLRLV